MSVVTRLPDRRRCRQLAVCKVSDDRLKLSYLGSFRYRLHKQPLRAVTFEGEETQYAELDCVLGPTAIARRSQAVTEIPVASDRQSAVRLLACIDAGSVPVTDESWGVDVVAILRSQSRLQALDFWMRNPDYLANELLNEFEKTKDEALIQLVQQIFDSREPDLRRLPMIRYHFGAFEPLDNPLAILRASDLIRVRREGVPSQVREHLYLLTRRGRASMNELAAASPEIAWYKDRAAVVATLAGEVGGKALKDRQYLQQEYASTELKHLIAPVTDRVRDRLELIQKGLAA